MKLLSRQTKLDQGLTIGAQSTEEVKAEKQEQIKEEKKEEKVLIENLISKKAEKEKKEKEES